MIEKFLKGVEINTLGDLRKFINNHKDLPDEAPVRSDIVTGTWMTETSLKTFSDFQDGSIIINTVVNPKTLSSSLDILFKD